MKSSSIGETPNNTFIFNKKFESLTEYDIAQEAAQQFFFDEKDSRQITAEHLEIDYGVFENASDLIVFPKVTVTQHKDRIAVSCDCNAENPSLCTHQVQVLIALIRRDDYTIFFNQSVRKTILQKHGADYGLENVPNPDQYFQIELVQSKLVITSKLNALLPVTKQSLQLLKTGWTDETALIPGSDTAVEEQPIIVFRTHKHYHYLMIELYSAATSKEGKIKNPLVQLVPMELIWNNEDVNAVKFFAGIHKFQVRNSTKKTQADITALLAIIENPLQYDCYYHNATISEKISASSLTAVNLKVLKNEIQLKVDKQADFYEISGTVGILGSIFSLKDLFLCFDYFILERETLYLVVQLAALNVIELLQKKTDNLLIHTSKFNEFKLNLLNDIEEKINIDYTYIPPATKKQIKAHYAAESKEKILYLSDFGGHVMLIPVVRYGEVEIQVRTKRLIFAADKNGADFLVKRDEQMETAFTVLLMRQHQHIAEQLENGLHYFYLHKQYFLDEIWLLDTFEALQQEHVTVLGFNEIEGNKLNPHKVKIDIKVLSGINWFNAHIGVKFGKKKASLKHLHKAIRNKSKFVTLDDGTHGILPLEWIEKFKNYFNISEITEAEKLLIPKINFSDIEALFEEEMLADEVKHELQTYRNKLSGFESISEVAIPKTLNAILRPYQHQGLNWLNFLDDFNFGGCLADDMGLGKSIQIIAFILSQREKTEHNTNLLVVPTTLLFNWKLEVEKFAPSIKILTVHGNNRTKKAEDFENYEIVMTSYGTLLSDIHYLKQYHFNYIFLDESQNIKNPSTERYKAIRLLKSRNKIAITGTPIENNTFDLYSQFSFACPGLLGNRQYFRDVYSIPIDRLKNTKRSIELQNKIKPFLLRRTKQEVATELPDKTEMVLYCEMHPEQRILYDAYEKEFRDYISSSTSDELRKNAMNVLKGLTKLRQICDAPALLGSDALTGAIPSSKIEILTEEILNKAPQHKILVFSQFVSMLELIEKEINTAGIASVKLTGKTNNREKVVQQFQENDSIRVFLISLKAGGTGLNLTEADCVYLVDPWWNPAVENQAIDRVYRIGQHKNVLAIRMICPDTIEEKIMTLQASKKELAADLIHEDASFFNNLSQSELLELLADNK